MKKFKLNKYYIIILSVFISFVILDILTKNFAVNANEDFIPGFMSFYYTLNTGAGWSILADQTLLLTIISAIIFVIICVIISFYNPKNKLFSCGVGLILAGAFGNLYDRIFLGAVRDFIRLDFINFPIFNIADACLTVGAIFVCIWLIFYFGKKEKTNGTKNI